MKWLKRKTIKMPNSINTHRHYQAILDDGKIVNVFTNDDFVDTDYTYYLSPDDNLPGEGITTIWYKSKEDALRAYLMLGNNAMEHHLYPKLESAGCFYFGGNHIALCDTKNHAVLSWTDNRGFESRVSDKCNHNNPKP